MDLLHFLFSVGPKVVLHKKSLQYIGCDFILCFCAVQLPGEQDQHIQQNCQTNHSSLIQICKYYSSSLFITQIFSVSVLLNNYFPIYTHFYKCFAIKVYFCFYCVEKLVKCTARVQAECSGNPHNFKKSPICWICWVQIIKQNSNESIINLIPQKVISEDNNHTGVNRISRDQVKTITLLVS